MPRLYDARSTFPWCRPFPTTPSLAAGLSNDDVARIRDILDSYHYTNALALVVLSALVMHFEPNPAGRVTPSNGAPRPLGVKIAGIAADAITEA